MFLPVDLSGQRVLVTAGAAGIGRVIAGGFAERGARVHVCDVDAAALDHARAELPGLGTSLTDVADPAAVDAMFRTVAETLGGLDVLVNNAGIAGPTAAIEEVEPDALERTLSVNVAGMFHAARRAVPMLKAAGGGAMVNLGSIAGRLGFPLRSPYSASKWAVVGLTKSLAVELGPAQIRVNAVLPGHVNSERFRRVAAMRAETLGIPAAEMQARFLEPVSLGRTVEAEDIANMILYLASPFGATITGQAISVCGDVQMMR